KDFLPAKLTLSALNKAAQHCEGCHLYQDATQTVFGEGSKDAQLIIVGEIPGDKEDIQGKPFVGPAGALLRQALEFSDLDWEDIYLTNVVKHFKFYYKNNRRMHRSPVGAEIKACKPWLDAEIKVVQPKVIVCLGAVAAKSLIDKKFQINKSRGKWFEYNFTENISGKVLATYHPSAILRAPDEVARHEMKQAFIKDFKKVAKAICL
ncbi:MAG TPA: UdgX family uracil-DNA binding protein, partial [Gammaproteobacteria bacterium]|nr:UdgX family uracil-DNA binding protein [Gammaproteobacteria bacterium]